MDQQEEIILLRRKLRHLLGELREVTTDDDVMLMVHGLIMQPTLVEFGG